MALSIQGREVAAYHTFLLGNSETATFDVTLRGPGNSRSVLFFNVRWEPDGDPGVTWKAANTPDDRLLEIVVRGWKDPRGTALRSFQDLGKVRGRGLYFQVAQQFIGETVCLQVWVLWDGWHP